MAEPINGSLYVDAYTPTGNPGEYTFENGLFNNQNDSGNGAYDIVPGFVVFISPTDLNTGLLIQGYTSRYVLTSVTVVDTVRVSGTILWDGKEPEVNMPSNGVFSIVSQTTPNLKLAIPAVDNFYTDLTAGSTLSALLNDIINIMDTLGTGNSPRTISTMLPVTTNGQTEFTLQYPPTNKEFTSITVNGLKYVYGVTNDFTINETTLTWTDQSLVLDMSDVVIISYTY